MARVDAFLKMLAQMNGSDMYLFTNSSPLVKVDNKLVSLEFREISRTENRRFITEILSTDQTMLLESRGDLEFSYSLHGIGRFRVSCFNYYQGLGAIFRYVPPKAPSLDSMNLPETINKLLNIKQGLVIFAGPSGCGKSTTLASVLDAFNTNHRYYVVSIEDPVEFVHKSRESIFSQREIGLHCTSFAAGVFEAQREQPDIIHIGEIKDAETAHAALKAVEAGIIVVTCMRTTNASKTLQRFIDLFPINEQAQLRLLLSVSLKAIISQVLVHHRSGKGRLPAAEILLNSPEISVLIREDKLSQLPSAIQNHRQEGMQLLDESLSELVNSGDITSEEARQFAENPRLFGSSREERYRKRSR